jgi:hypothetical protein
MSLTIDELSQSSSYRRRTSSAAPAQREHPSLGALGATVFVPSLAPCAALAPRSAPHACCPHRHGCLATGLATERRCTHDLRVLNRATWSARRGSRLLMGRDALVGRGHL